jgi:hypothetical protein
MARQEAQNIFLENGTDETELLEIYGGVIENFEKGAVSLQIKAQNPSKISAGSAEFKRFENATSNAYGTARSASAGVALRTKPIVVPIDQHKEIIEEFVKADVEAYGVPALLSRRAGNHYRSMVRELDTAFFAMAYAEGTEKTLTATAIDEMVEELIVEVETISNDFIDGVDRDDIAVVLTPAKASLLRNKIDTLFAEGNRIENGLIGQFHGVDVFVSNRLPKGVGQVVDMMAMVKGAVAQPVLLADQYQSEKIPLSNDWAVELFYDFGTKALMEDTIFYVGDEYSVGS